MAINAATFKRDLLEIMPTFETQSGRKRFVALLDTLVAQANLVRNDADPAAAQVILNDGTAAVSLAAEYTYLRETDGGTHAITLADWTEGSHSTKIIIASAITTGQFDLTPVSLAGGTVITFDATSEAAIMKWNFTDSQWYPVALISWATGSFLAGPTLA